MSNETAQLRPLPQSWRKSALKSDISERSASASSSTYQQFIAPSTAAKVSSTTRPAQRLSQVSENDAYSIRTFTPREAEFMTTPKDTAAFASVRFAGDVGDVRQPAATAKTLDSHRTLHYSLKLLIDALSFNHLTIKDGFNAFDVDEDGLISLRDLHSSVDDLQLELDVETIQLMHRFLDVDADGFISKKEWIAGLDSVQSGKAASSSAAKPPANPSHTAFLIPTDVLATDPLPEVRVPVGLDPSAQAHMAFETVRERLMAALQAKADSDSRAKFASKLEGQVSSAEHAATQIKGEIAVV